MKVKKGLLSGKIPGSLWNLRARAPWWDPHRKGQDTQLHPHSGPLGEDAGGAWCRAGRAESSRHSNPGVTGPPTLLGPGSGPET